MVKSDLAASPTRADLSRSEDTLNAITMWHTPFIDDAAMIHVSILAIFDSFLLINSIAIDESVVH